MHGRTVQWLACTLAAAVVFGACGLASAQDAILMDPGYAMATSQPGAAATNRLVSTSYTSELEARVAALESALQDEVEEDGWEDVSAEGWSHRVGGLAHFDTAMMTSQDSDIDVIFGNLKNYFEARRLRLFVAGEGYGVYDYKLEVDFAAGDDYFDRGSRFQPADDLAEIKDAYVGIHEIPWFGYVRAGHFYEVTSLEQQTHDNYTTFMERALPLLAFHPRRQFGIATYNYTDDEQFTVSGGAFLPDINEEHKELFDDELAIDLCGRGTWNPWYTAEGRGVLHVGGGYNFVDARGRHTFRVNPEIHRVVNIDGIDAGEVAVLNTGPLFIDSYSIYSFESALVYGPFSLQSEIFLGDIQGEAGQADSDLYGAYVMGSYFLTGENRPYNRQRAKFGRVVPFTNFFIVRTADGSIQSGWGAWELAARWSWVEAREDIDVGGVVQTAGSLNDITLGVNWYLNPNARVMFNYIHSWADFRGPFDGANQLGHTVGELDIAACRVQVDF